MGVFNHLSSGINLDGEKGGSKKGKDRLSVARQVGRKRLFVEAPFRKGDLADAGDGADRCLEPIWGTRATKENPT